MDFTFSHEETRTGGSKYPRKDTLHAHHPETGEIVGTARYFPPKRKGGKVSVEEWKGEAPGAGSQLFDEMQRRHPGSEIVPLYPRKKHHGPASDEDPRDFGKPTDWDTHYPTLPPTVNRGISIPLDRMEAKQIHGGRHSVEEDAELLTSHVQRSIGMHWSATSDKGRTFAETNVEDPRAEVPVMLHAKTPERRQIETRPHILRNKGVWPFDHYAGDAEVPFKKGTPVHLTGISWKPDVEHPEADEHGWVHHTFDEPRKHTAGRDAGDEFRPVKMGANQDEPESSIRMVPPEEYSKYHYPDYRVKTLPALIKHFRKTSPEYYDKIKSDVQQNGFTTPVLVRTHGPGGRRLPKPQVMEGHHRAAVAYDLGLPLLVGDYDNQTDYDTAFKAGQQWFRTHQRPEEGISWSKEATARPELHSRIFGPTKGSLDPRLFERDRLRPEVRQGILERLGASLEPVLGLSWMEGIQVYLAGSEASEWYGNDDLDVLVGIDYDHAEDVPAFEGLSDEDITAMINQLFWSSYNDEDWHAPFGGVWHATAYANPDIGRYSIGKIKPYAAYDVIRNEWIVKPPHLEHWSIADFPEGPELLKEAEAYADLIESIDRMPEPYRSRQGKALWDHLHSERSRAFSDEGEGWLDSGNAIEKALNEWGIWNKLVQMKYGSEYQKTAGWENREISGLHRGMGVDLPEDLHAYVHDPSIPRQDRARRLLEHISASPFGMHWTDDPDVARGFASRAARKEHQDEPDEHSTPVVVHAQGPDVEHIETDRDTLYKKRIRSYDDEKDAESEVPLKAGAPVNVVGLSWADPASYRRGRHDFKRSYFDEPVQKIASSEQPVEHVRVDKLWPHREWNHARGDYSYDREGGGPYAYKHDAESWDANKASVAAEGIREPITLHYNPRQNAAYIGEGNHRLHWARELGYETVPVRVWRTSSDMDPRFNLTEQGPKIEGHFPQDPRPSSVLPASWFPGNSKEAGKNGDLPKGLTFQHLAPESNPSWGPDNDTHTLHAYADNGDHAGELSWFGEDGMIRDVDVHPDYRRRGVATELLRRARIIQPEVHHSGIYTSDGAQWAGKIAMTGMEDYFKIASSDDEDDYRMQHRPADESGIPIHDLTQGMPADVYTYPQYYDPNGQGEPEDGSFHRAYSLIQEVRGNPDARVTIYRSLPAEHAHQGFRPGDWVTPSLEYARQHGKHHSDEDHDWPVIKATVKAKHLFTDGDDLREFGYTGPARSGGIGFSGGKHQKIKRNRRTMDIEHAPIVPKTSMRDYFVGT